jgi:hypothetical protein
MGTGGRAVVLKVGEEGYSLQRFSETLPGQKGLAGSR